MEKTFFAGSQLLTTIGVPAGNFIRTKKTREFSPRVSLKFEANLRASLLLLPPV
jgi:hypothetical protein